ncbi:MAG: chorismate synthase [Firmicutes bacterium]|nr:chorismate synthase [Bacillota bacterium]
MSSSFNGNIKFTIFGQSHSPAIGVTVEGLPAGFEPDMSELARFMQRRAPGRNEFSTPRSEADVPEFISGLFDGRLCGTPLTAIIKNTNTRSGDYSELKYKPRPGHADFTAGERYNNAQDYTGGGHFSGRLTAPLCIVGGLCLQLLRAEGISVVTRIAELGGVADKGEICSTADKPFPVVNDECGEKMKAAILSAKAEGDSVGGIIECAVSGCPAGIGDPMFGGMENRISSLVFGIPAVKGIEFGAGFDAAKMLGSENNDPFAVENGNIITKTNNCGGILGGITTGMPIVFRAAVKPTPSIAREQDTVDLRTLENTKLTVHGRHDPCIVPRAVPCIEAAAAIAVYDALLEKRKDTK